MIAVLTNHNLFVLILLLIVLLVCVHGKSIIMLEFVEIGGVKMLRKFRQPTRIVINYTNNVQQKDMGVSLLIHVHLILQL